MSRNRADFTNDPQQHSLLDIPRDVIVSHIAKPTMFSLNDCAALSQSCKTLHRFFKTRFLETGAAHLLNAMVYCDVETIKKIVSANPETMFTQVSCRDLNGHEFVLCPLAYTLRQRNWYAIHICMNALKSEAQQTAFNDLCKLYFPRAVHYDRNAPLFSDAEKLAAQPFIDLVHQWLMDDSTVTIDHLIEFLVQQSGSLSSPLCFNLQPGFWAYMACEHLFHEFQQHINPDLITHAKLSEYIDHVIRFALRHLFPREMLAQMMSAANGGQYHWTNTADFAETELPANWMFVRNCNLIELAYLSIFPDTNLYHPIQCEESIWRGEAPEACIGGMMQIQGRMILEVVSIRNDAYILKHLANVREEQFSLLCQPKALMECQESAEEASDSDDQYVAHSVKQNKGCSIL